MRMSVHVMVLVSMLVSMSVRIEVRDFGGAADVLSRALRQEGLVVRSDR